MAQLVSRSVDPFETAHVNRSALIRGDVRRASAGGAKVMLIFAGAESIGANVGLRRLQMQLVVADEPVQIAVLAADSAIAIGEGIDCAFDLERDFPAVTSTLITHSPISLLLIMSAIDYAPLAANTFAISACASS